MRYQKWGKAGYKIYCYSQDKGKPHLARSDHCNNRKLWADELEEAVIADLFAMSSRKLGEETGEEQRGKGLDELLKEQIERSERKLKNLYHPYGDSGDETLAETIGETRKELTEAKERLTSLMAAAGDVKREKALWREIRSAEEAWDFMTQTEKQNVLRSCIEKIVVTYDRTDLYYKVLTESTK